MLRCNSGCNSFYSLPVGQTEADSSRRRKWQINLAKIIIFLKIRSEGQGCQGKPGASSRLGDDHGHGCHCTLFVSHVRRNVCVHKLMYTKPCHVRLGQIAIVAHRDCHKSRLEIALNYFHAAWTEIIAWPKPQLW